MHTLRPMTLSDHDAVIEMMAQTPGLRLRDSDSRESTARYLDRNPGLSLVCEVEGRIAGCIMCGHDGRRGYLQHLVVLPAHRRQGIAHALVKSCLDALETLGVVKSHVDVLRTNEAARAYCQSQGWQLRSDIDRYSHVGPGGENA